MTQGVTITVSVEYDGAGYSTEEVAELLKDLSQVGATRSREYYMPAAGDQLVWIVVSFFGMKLLEHAVWKPSVAVVSKAVKNWMARRANARRPEPAVLKIVYSFDDLDVVVFHPREDDLDGVAETLDLIRAHLGKGRLEGLRVTRVELPLESVGGKWGVPECDYCEGRGPNSGWAITTSCDEFLQRAPYDAAKDEWLSRYGGDEE